jgi:hypothetical protein
VGPRGGDEYIWLRTREAEACGGSSGKGAVSGGRELVPGASMVRVAWLPHGDGDL